MACDVTFALTPWLLGVERMNLTQFRITCWSFFSSEGLVSMFCYNGLPHLFMWTRNEMFVLLVHPKHLVGLSHQLRRTPLNSKNTFCAVLTLFALHRPLRESNVQSFSSSGGLEVRCSKLCTSKLTCGKLCSKPQNVFKYLRSTPNIHGDRANVTSVFQVCTQPARSNPGIVTLIY